MCLFVVAESPTPEQKQSMADESNALFKGDNVAQMLNPVMQGAPPRQQSTLTATTNDNAVAPSAKASNKEAGENKD